jgi:hypothetical protein
VGHDAEPAVAPELARRAEAVGRGHDRHELRRADRPQARRGLELADDGVGLGLLEQPLLGLVAERDELVELLAEPLGQRPVR